MGPPPAPAAAERRPRRRGDVTAERILDAAEALFADRGYGDTTLRDVAHRVGIRAPSLYNHFPSKESLYSAVLARGLDPVLETLARFASQPTAERRPGEIVERIMELLAERPDLPRLVLHETAAGGQHLTPVLREWIAPAFARGFELAQALDSDAERLRLRVLAIYNVLVGYFVSAPIYEALDGEDLLAPAAVARQTRFLGELADALFPGEEPGSGAEAADVDANERRKP